MVSPLPLPASPVVFYDGHCGVCDASVQWLLTHDRAGTFRFAPLQGDTAAALRERHPEMPAELDSVLLVEPSDAGERVSWHSTAVFRILARLPWPWRALAWLGALPRPLTDLGYRLFARVRLAVGGKRDACRIPTPAERARFLP